MKKANYVLWLLLMMAFINGASDSAKATAIKNGPILAAPIVTNAAPLVQDQNSSVKNDSSTAEKVDKKVQQVKDLFSLSIIFSILVLIIVTYFVVRLLARIIDNLAERSSRYRLIIKRLVPIIRI